eukprot:CAMPEP_0179051868 /NCGR_PEP_ID=MMETSP0796-20121207/21463_1 /TAXON_ID=73915 /ORGANISM="Pyrodinium bahamense, Strain pbaha01" /LENGTH=270 /DNA_ID=CAMNT_0020748415 /DNA_START=195 /DNA_END=1004 /DNA_ORIENTATION=+
MTATVLQQVHEPPNGIRTAWLGKAAAATGGVHLTMILDQVDNVRRRPPAHMPKQLLRVLPRVQPINHDVRQPHRPTRPQREFVSTPQQLRKRLPTLRVGRHGQHQARARRRTGKLADGAAGARCGEAHGRGRNGRAGHALLPPAVASAGELAVGALEEPGGPHHLRVVQRLARAVESHMVDLVVHGKRSHLAQHLIAREIPLEGPYPAGTMLAAAAAAQLRGDAHRVPAASVLARAPRRGAADEDGLGNAAVIEPEEHLQKMIATSLIRK